MPVTDYERLMSAVMKLQKTYNSKAFKYIYDILSPKIYYTCLRYLKDTDEAQDALQESFVIIYEKIKTFGGNGSFEGWSKKIAVNHCIYRLKKRKINVELREDHIPYTEQIEFDLYIEKNETKNQLKQALQELPDGYRTIINLNILEGYSHIEIAQMLNIKEGTSRSQLNRAKAALRKLISVKN